MWFQNETIQVNHRLLNQPISNSYRFGLHAPALMRSRAHTLTHTVRGKWRTDRASTFCTLLNGKPHKARFRLLCQTISTFFFFFCFLFFLYFLLLFFVVAVCLMLFPLPLHGYFLFVILPLPLPVFICSSFFSLSFTCCFSLASSTYFHFVFTFLFFLFPLLPLLLLFPLFPLFPPLLLDTIKGFTLPRHFSCSHMILCLGWNP